MEQLLQIKAVFSGDIPESVKSFPRTTQ